MEKNKIKNSEKQVILKFPEEEMNNFVKSHTVMSKKGKTALITCSILLSCAAIGVGSAALAFNLLGNKSKVDDYIEVKTATKLNQILKEKVNPDSNITLHDRFNTAGIIDIVGRLNNRFLYSYNQNTFIPVDEFGNVLSTVGDYKINTQITETKSNDDIYTFTTPDHISDKFCNYLKYGEVSILTSINIDKSFDAGDSTGILNIVYSNDNETVKKSLIRTNDTNTTLTINAENDTVYHFGDVGTVDIKNINLKDCFDEYGYAKEVLLKKGKINFKSGSITQSFKILAADASNVAAYREDDTEIVKSLIYTKGVLTEDTNTNFDLETPNEGEVVFPVEEGKTSEIDNYVAGVKSNSSSTVYETLDAAINAATTEGDTINLLKDCNIEKDLELSIKNLVLDGCGFSISGVGYEQYGTTKKSGIVVKKDNITIKNLYLLDTCDYAAIECGEQAGTKIKNVSISKIGRMGIDVNGSSATLEVDNCCVDLTYMKDNTGNGIQAQYGAKLTVKNTTVENVLEQESKWSSSGICFWDDSTGIVDNCTLKNVQYGFGVENYDATNKLNLSITNTKLTGKYGFDASTANGTNSFIINLGEGNDFNVKETIGDFWASSTKTITLNGEVNITGGNYVANDGKNALFIFNDYHETWTSYLKSTIKITGGTTTGKIAEAKANGVVLQTLPEDIKINDQR